MDSWLLKSIVLALLYLLTDLCKDVVKGILVRYSVTWLRKKQSRNPFRDLSTPGLQALVLMGSVWFVSLWLAYIAFFQPRENHLAPGPAQFATGTILFIVTVVAIVCGYAVLRPIAASNRA